MSQYCCQDRIRAAQSSIDCFAFAVSADNLACSRLPHGSFGISRNRSSAVSPYRPEPVEGDVSHCSLSNRGARRACGSLHQMRPSTARQHLLACVRAGTSLTTPVKIGTAQSVLLSHMQACVAGRRGPAARDWMAARSEDVLPVAYFHVVFTLPVEIANIACWNKKAVYALLFKASAKTVATIAADPKRLGARVGMTRVLHTLGIGVMLNARLWRDPIPPTST